MRRLLFAIILIVAADSSPSPLRSMSWLGARAIAQEPQPMETEQAPQADNTPSAEETPRAEETPHSNRLISETSPYLLQHAHNPVDWYPWGEAAFEKARRENKPIFLSVGYSTCYWCHVMEVESFEDAEVAAVINKHFVAIKVDREERPDIDEQYMLATQLMTGRGGWPNSVWLTPDGKPWMAGTYFPKQNFISVLEQIHSFWVTRREDVNRQASSLAEAAKLAGAADRTAEGAEPTPLSIDLVGQAGEKLIQQFDTQHGGFGGAPKFPPHGTLALLMERYRSTRDSKQLAPITATLDAMWLGGIHDHLGGGFHRYATDTHWLLPHFEKMLYDNAQLMHAYADGYEITGEERYRAAVADIFRWIDREMTSPQGAFYSALDSGEVGKEGEAYVWSMQQLAEVLSQEESALFAETYQFAAEGNFHDESSGELTGENIPHLKQPLEVIAQTHVLGQQAFINRLSTIEAKLIEHRLTWPQPRKDDKILTSWNALMIDALAYAGQHCQQPRYIVAASKAADFLWESMFIDGVLLRTYRVGTAKQAGYLDDYVYFSKALLELHRATDEDRFRDRAIELIEIVIDQFQDEQHGGFFFTGDSYETLLVRSKNLGGGGNMPNVNGIAVQVLVEMMELTGDGKYGDIAFRALQTFAGAMNSQPHTTEDLLVGASMYFESAPPPVDVAVDAKKSKRAGPVQITVELSKDQMNQGQSLEAIVTLVIDQGWHLYGENPAAQFLVQTQVSITSKAEITLGDMVRPQAQTSIDPILKTDVKTYVGTIQFKVPVMIAANVDAGPVQLEIEVKTQACDESRCLKPATTTFQLPIKVVAAD